MSESVKIAVRTRPFNEKELAVGDKVCIHMVSNNL
jgi:hypothetical protein